MSGVAQTTSGYTLQWAQDGEHVVITATAELDAGELREAGEIAAAIDGRVRLELRGPVAYLDDDQMVYAVEICPNCQGYGPVRQCRDCKSKLA